MFNKVFNALQRYVNMFTAALLASLCVVIFIQVIMRYVMGQSLAWSEELTRYMFVWIIYLGVNLGIRDDVQIKIDILDLLLKGKAVKALKLFQHLVSLVTVVAGMVASYYLIKIGFLALSPTLRIPMWVAYVAFPVGFAFDFIEIIRKMIGLVTSWNADEGGVPA